MIRPRLRIPRAPRFGGLARPCTTPFPVAFVPTAAPSPIGRRLEHTRPKLVFDTIAPEARRNWLLSEDGYNIAWRSWQGYLLGKLNALTAETEFETMNLKDILLATARDPEFAHIFNYASAAHNNHFFFKHLAPGPVPIPPSLQTQIDMSFGSTETLRREMVNTAGAMFGPGFVWLVFSKLSGGFPTLKVVPTYLAGSPYPGAHWRRQDSDLSTAVGPTEPGLAKAREYLADTSYGQGTASAAAARRKEIAPGGIELFPVLCLSVWDHTYLRDYGVGSKLQFAEHWWNFIDWTTVAAEAESGK